MPSTPFAILLFIGLPAAALAQQTSFLKNPDIIWAAEFETTYSLTLPPAVDPRWDNDIVYWKNYDPKNPIQYQGAELLIRNMLQAARSGAWPAWQIHNPTEQLSLSEVADSLSWNGHDTIVVFDPITYEESVQIVDGTELEPSGFTTIRARQLLYFDDQKGEFGLSTLAVAPVFNYTMKVKARHAWQGGRDTLLYQKVPFWLNMPADPKKTRRTHPDVNDANIAWAAQLITFGNSPEPDRLKPLKNTKPRVMQALLDRFRYDPQYTATDFYNDPLPFESREKLFVSIDTTVQYNPDTYAETVEIQRHEIRAENVPMLRLVENWYWDERQQRLIIRLERFAPLVERPELMRYKWLGYSAWNRPLFYRRKK